MQLKPNQTGFTLIELLIVVVVIGILAAIAVPSYLEAVKKSRRADGRAALMALQLAQEKFRATCPYYAQNIGTTYTCGASASASTVVFSSASPDGYYTVAMEAGSASLSAFTANASPQGSQASDNTTCGSANFRITQSGPDKSSAAKIVCWGN
jgi:type IV pilus assembly protein PilE